MHPDPLIQQMFDIWLPRFINGGIHYFDLITATDRMRTWDDWGPEWAKMARVHEALAEEAWEKGRRISAVQAFLTAARYYHLSYFVYTRDAAIHEQGLLKMVECYERVLPYLEPAVEKVRIAFEDTYLVGLFSRPRTETAPPVVILIPGLDSTKEGRHNGRGNFLRRGIAALSIDGPGQGESSLRLKIRPDYEKVIGAAIDYLEQRGDVDAARVGLLGSSLGGYYAPRAAAFEPRVKAAVGSCGPYDFSECFESMPQMTREAYMLYSGAGDMDEALELSRKMSLKGAAERITCPLLVLHGKQDPLIPWQQGKRIADEAGGPTEFVLFEEGVHSLSNIPYRGNPMIADWLAEHLGGTIV